MTSDDSTHGVRSDSKLNNRLETTDVVCAVCCNPIDGQGVDDSGFCINCFANRSAVQLTDNEKRNSRLELGFLAFILFCAALMLFQQTFAGFLLAAFASIISGTISNSTMGAIAAVLSFLSLVAFAFVVMVFT